MRISSVGIVYFPDFTSKKRVCSSCRADLQERTSDFQIIKFSDIPCPACGKKMLTQRRFEEISKELSSASNDKYLEILRKYREYMRPVEESVFDEIYKISLNPNASKDIRTLLVSLRNKKLPLLQETQLRLVNKMTALARTLPDDEKNVLLKKLKKLRGHIRKTNSEAPFRRKILLDRISKIKIRNPFQYQKLQAIAKNFPTSSDLNSAWIVKYSGKNKANEAWSSLETAKRFLFSSVANTDHILAYNIENNHDDISNYLAMHCSCNSQKGNKSFMQWIYEDKDNRISFLRNYFHKAAELIKKCITDNKYKSYVDSAIGTICKCSGGKIKILA